MEILIVLGFVILMVAIIWLVVYFTQDEPYKRNKNYGGGGDIHFHSYNSIDSHHSNNDFDGFGGGSGGGGGYSGSYGDDGDSGGDGGGD